MNDAEENRFIVFIFRSTVAPHQSQHEMVEANGGMKIDRNGFEIDAVNVVY